MDTYAKGLLVAQKLLEDRIIEDFIEERYSSYNHGIGKKIVQNETDFEELEEYALSLKDIHNHSGRQEMLEGIVNQYIYHSN